MIENSEEELEALKALREEITGKTDSSPILTVNILRSWDSKRIEWFATHLLGEEYFRKIHNDVIEEAAKLADSENSGYVVEAGFGCELRTLKK